MIMAKTKSQSDIRNEIGQLKKAVTDMKQKVDFIKDVFEDKFLSNDDKKAIDEALKAKKHGKLKSMEEAFN